MACHTECIFILLRRINSKVSSEETNQFAVDICICVPRKNLELTQIHYEGLANKKLYRAFSRQANGFTLNISVLQGLLRVNGKTEKDA